MKKIFALVVILFISLYSNAQDPQLFENDWYLQSVFIDDIQYLPPNIISEPETGIINFYEEVSYIDIIYCDIISPIIEYSSNDNVFTLEDDPVIFPGECLNSENNAFASIYYSVFFDQTTAKNPFIYSINNDNEIAVLTIVNPNGGVAVYGSEILSNQDFNAASFTIYPNPANHLITIENTNQDSINRIMVYDDLGRLVLEQNNPSNQLDITKLDKGLLFLTIKTDNGFFTKKIIKQ